MSNGVGKNTTLNPCLAYRCLVKITHLDTLLDTLCCYYTTNHTIQTPHKKTNKN